MVRIKNRYFLVEYHFPGHTQPDLTLNEKLLAETVLNSVHENYGEFGLGTCQKGLKVVYLALLTQTCLIRFPASFEKQGRVCLSSIVVLHGRMVVLNVVHVGGTIKACQKVLVKHGVNTLHRRMLDCKSEGEREKVRAVLATTLSNIENICF